MKGVVFSGVFVVSMVAGWSIASSPESGEVNSHADIEQGQALYLTHCMECHGSGGRGDGPRAAFLAPRPGNLVSAATSSKTDKELLEIIDDGVPRTAMPGWKDKLSEEERLNVLAFVRSLIHFQDPSPTPSPP
jgi:mono/diheme cytochrome c family protein